MNYASEIETLKTRLELIEDTMKQITDLIVYISNTPEVPEPMPVIQHGRTSVQRGTGVNVWVLSPPEPYTDAVIVCSPDDTEPVGMRCYVEKKAPGGERTKYAISYTEMEKK